MKKPLAALVAGILSLRFSTLAAQPFVARSGPDAVALIELFSSEGCSSCPPAEEWLAELSKRPGLWKEFVPISFHVNYWDGLGWPDRFASPSNTLRQQTYAAQWRKDSVYTPEMVCRGNEWRSWQNWRAGFPVPGHLDAPGILEIRSTEGGRFEIEYRRAGIDGGTYIASIAWLGSDLKTDVRGGENAGRHLRHGFVALRQADSRLFPSGDVLSATVSLPRPERSLSGRLAIAAWVSRAGSLTPLQAAGGWFAP